MAQNALRRPSGAWVGLWSQLSRSLFRASALRLDISFDPMSPLLPILLALPIPQDSAPAPQPESQSLEITLRDALRLAKAYSLTLQVSEATEEAARYERDARWASFDWLLRVDGSLADAKYEGNSELSGAPVLDQRDQGLSIMLSRPTSIGTSFEVLYDSKETTTNNDFAYLPHSTTGTLTIGITQPLLAGRGRDYTTALQFQGDNEYAYQTESVRAVRRGLVERVLQTYWSLAAAQGAAKSADLGVEFANEFLRIAESRFDSGVGLELDVLQAQTEVARRAEAQTQVQIARMNAEDSLKQILYTTNNPRMWMEDLVATDDLPEPPKDLVLIQWEEAFKSARVNNPELRQLELRLANTTRLLQVAESNEQSKLDLQIRLRTQGFESSAFDAFEESMDAEYPAMSAAVRWELPLSGALPRAQTRKKRAEVRIAQLEFDSAERQLISNLRIVLRTIELQALAFRSSVTTTTLSKRQQEIELARYREGRSTSVRVLAAQQAHLEALSSSIEARATYVIARGQLSVLLGRHDR
jgi:outer membrane protein TolC